MASLVPVMISFGMESSSNSFSLFEVDRKEKLSDLVESHGPDDWGDLSTTIVTKVSQSKSSPFDKFNLNNSVDLVLCAISKLIALTNRRRSSQQKKKHGPGKLMPALSQDTAKPPLQAEKLIS